MKLFPDRLRRWSNSRGRLEPHPDLVRLTEEDRRYLTSLYDDSTPLPADAESALSSTIRVWAIYASATVRSIYP